MNSARALQKRARFLRDGWRFVSSVPWPTLRRLRLPYGRVDLQSLKDGEVVQCVYAPPWVAALVKADRDLWLLESLPPARAEGYRNAARAAYAMGGDAAVKHYVKARKRRRT